MKCVSLQPFSNPYLLLFSLCEYIFVIQYKENNVFHSATSCTFDSHICGLWKSLDDSET